MYIKKSNICRKSLKSYIIKERSNAVLKFFETPSTYFLKFTKAWRPPNGRELQQCTEASSRGDNATMLSLASGSSYVFLYRYLLVYVYKYFIGGKDSLLLLKSQSWAALGVVYCVKKKYTPHFSLNKK